MSEISDKKLAQDKKHNSASSKNKMERSTHLTITYIDETADKTQNTIKILSIIFEAIQAIGAIATVFAVVVAILTLKEMEEERNTAYQPEIVITPNLFEGNLEKDDNKECLYINTNESDPVIAHYDTPPRDSRYAYLEKPYLTLKNIGQGIAKDVQVTFPEEWIDRAIDTLNEYSSDYYHFTVDTYVLNDEETSSIHYTITRKQESERFLTHKGITKENLTYIAPGNDSVNVRLPENWCMILQALFKERIQLKGPQVSPYMCAEEKINIPDPIILIEYSDVQGLTYSKEIVVPWTCYFTYMKSSESEDAEVESMDLFAGFYTDYIR